MKQELLDKSLKREMTGADLETSLGVILEDSMEDYGLFSNYGITKLGELLSIDYKVLVKAQEEGKIKGLGKIKRAVHKYGCTLRGEYEELGISEEEALIPVSELEVCSRAKRALRRTGCIDVLGELLSTPYSKLANISSFGVKSQEDLKVYIESLGYNLQSSGESVEGIKERLRNDGEILVEDVIDSREIMLTLNRASIYTLDGLLERDFRSIPGIGEVFEGEIIQSLKGLKLDTPTQELSSGVISDKEAELVRLIQERNELRMRHVALVLEQAEVTAQLKEIKSRIKGASTGVQYGKK